MTVPKVTLVVSPRERFSYAQTSLESIYEHTHVKGRWRLREKMCRQGQRVAQVAHKLKRTLAEPVAVLMYGALTPVDRVLNRYLTSRHAPLWLKPQRASAVEPLRLVAELPTRSPQGKVNENSYAA